MSAYLLRRSLKIKAIQPVAYNIRYAFVFKVLFYFIFLSFNRVYNIVKNKSNYFRSLHYIIMKKFMKKMIK